MTDDRIKFQAIFDQTYEFIELLSAEGRLLEANITALRLIGAEKTDVAGSFFWETPWWAHSPELQEQVRLAVKKAATGESARFEATHFSADGRLLMIDLSLKPVLDKAGKVVFLLSEGRDITERKRTEAALRRSETELRSFVELSPFGIFRISIEKDKFLTANPALVKMLGYPSAEELCSAALSTEILLDPQDRMPILTQLLQDGSVSGIELPFRRRTGESITVSFGGQLMQESLTGDLVIEGTVEDISDRKRAEQALRDSEEHFRQVVESTPVGIYIATDGILRYLNPAALAMFGAESARPDRGPGLLRKNSPGQPFFRDGAHPPRRMKEKKKSRTLSYLEERILRLDGTSVDGEVTAVPFVFEGRDGALVFVRDITEKSERAREARA